MTAFTDRITGTLSGVSLKAPVRAVTTAAITLAGLQTINGVVLVAGDRVLVKDQTTGAENGIWIAASTAWQRAQDFAGNRDAVQGTLVTVAATTNVVLQYKLVTADPIVIGTTALEFVETESGAVGSNYGLIFDGATDQAVELQAVLDTAAENGQKFVILASDDGSLVIGSRFKVPTGVTLDASKIDLDYIGEGEPSIFGDYVELPESNLFRLAADAEPGDTTITVDASDYGSHTLLAADAFGVLRGENDANGNAIQRHEFRIVSKNDSGGISALVLTIDPPIPDDQGTFTPVNVGSAWTPGETGIDRSLVTVRTASLVASNIARGDISFDVADGSLFAEGAVAMLQDDRLASDPGTPDEGQPMRQEMVRIKSISSNTITLQQRVSRDFVTSENAALIKIAAATDAHLILGKIRRIEASPASPASRRHGALMYFADRCSIRGVYLNEDDHTYSLRGQAARATRSIDCKILDVTRIGPKNTAAGDGVGIGNFYSTNTEMSGCYTERCRHGMQNQGSTRANRHDNTGVNNLINTLDDHGVYETDTWDHDNRAYGGNSLAADSTQQLGATYGNTRWHEGSHWAVSEDNVFVNFLGTTDGGLAIRPGTTDLVERNTYAECAIPIRVNADRRAPAKQIARIRLGGTVIDDPSVGISIDGRVQIWEDSGAVTGTTARPVYIDDDTGTRRYSTTDTGALGSSNPTATSGTEVSGDITLAYVGLVASQTATIDDVRITADLDKAGTAVTQYQATNVNVLPALLLLDEDDMTSDSATAAPSQQSVKAFAETIQADLQSQIDDFEAATLVSTTGTSVASSNELALGLADRAFAASAGAFTERLCRLVGDTPASALNVTFFNGAAANSGKFWCYRPLSQTGAVTLKVEAGAGGTGTIDGVAGGTGIAAPPPGSFFLVHCESNAGDEPVYRTNIAAFVDSITFVIDGGGSAITTGVKGFLQVPFDCAITSNTVLLDQSGSIVVDVWLDTYANYPPTDTDSITASAPPTVSAATKSTDSTLTGWTTSIPAGSVLGYNVDSVSTATRASVVLTVLR